MLYIGISVVYAGEAAHKGADTELGRRAPRATLKGTALAGRGEGGTGGNAGLEKACTPQC